MNRARFAVFAIFPLALSLASTGNVEANDCKPPVGVSGDLTAWAWGLNHKASSATARPPNATCRCR
jgi:hypothetical protein